MAIKWVPKKAFLIRRTDDRDHAVPLPSGRVAAFATSVWYVPVEESDEKFLEEVIVTMKGNPLFVVQTKGIVHSENRYLPEPDKPRKED